MAIEVINKHYATRQALSELGLNLGVAGWVSMPQSYGLASWFDIMERYTQRVPCTFMAIWRVLTQTLLLVLTVILPIETRFLPYIGT